MDSTDRYISTLPKNKNGLRPPFVWNFPIQRIEEIRDKLVREKEKVEEVHRSKNKRMTKKNTKPKLEINFKEETKKNEIRKVNPFPYYHDGRLEKFMDLFNELYRNFLIYCRSKGDPWEYVYCKILNVLGIEYSFKLPKEELPEYVPPSAEVNDENKEGEEEKKVEEKKEEKKEGEGETKKEESKENEPKEGEVKEGEVKEGEVKEEVKEGEVKEEIKNEEVKEGEIKNEEVKKVEEEKKEEVKEGEVKENNEQKKEEEEKNPN